MNKLLLSLCTVSLLGLGAPALAQQNLGHFYMARQQVQITDEVPIVDDRRTNPAAAASGAGITKPIPLPRAGWQGYSSAAQGGMGASLPKVVNGVPPKLPPPVLSPNRVVVPRRGTAGAMQQVRKAPATAKAYTPYKGYGGQPTAQSMPTNSGMNNSSSTAVKGNILHWNRGGH